MTVITRNDYEIIWYNLRQLLESAIVTLTVLFFVKKSSFANQKLLWSIMQLEYLTCFGVSFINCLRNSEEAYPELIMMKLVSWLFEIHFTNK